MIDSDPTAPRLACIREPLDYDKGLDVIDSRTGRTLAWRGGNGGKSAIELAQHLNAVYPDRDEAPASGELVEQIIGWRVQGVAG